MPIYSLLCPSCGDKNIMHRKVYERDLVPVCKCGGQYNRVLDKPMVIPEISPYLSPGTDKWVHSRSQRREDLKEANALEWEPGIEKDIARNKQYEIEKSFAPIAKGVDDIVACMNTAGKLGDLNG